MSAVNRKVSGGAVVTHLTVAITDVAPAAGQTLTLLAGTGSSLPDENFVLKFNPDLPTEEKILFSDRTGDVCTVAPGGRGFDGTVAADHETTEDIVHELDATAVTAIVDHIDNPSSDDHVQYLNTERHDVAARHTFGAALGTPSAALSVGTANSAGVGSRPAREDHQHKIADGAINSSDLFAPDVVDAAVIAPGAVGTPELADGAVTSAKIDPGALTVADGSVTTPKLADDAVTQPKIGPGAVTETELGVAAVSIAKIKAEAWSTYVPTLTQSGAVTKTVTSAHYQQVGKTVRFQVALAVTGSGSSGSVIVVGLPVTAKVSSMPMGSGWVWDNSAGHFLVGGAQGSGTSGVQLVANAADTGLGAGNTAFGLASNDLVFVAGEYEAA